MTAGARAAAALRERAETVARAATDALYAEMPGLMERYGARGREKCLQDLRYHVEHLVPAVELEDPASFGGYAAWCDEVLRTRGIPTGELVRCLALMERPACDGMDDEAAEVVRRCLRAGVDALAGAGAA